MNEREKEKMTNTYRETDEENRKGERDGTREREKKRNIRADVDV